GQIPRCSPTRLSAEFVTARATFGPANFVFRQRPMSQERINKFQPDRTLYLRGFTGFCADASLCEATPSSFKVYGVFRDQADFCVLVIYDADNQFEHYSVKY